MNGSAPALRLAEPKADTGNRRAPAWIFTVLILCGLVYTALFVDAVLRADSELLGALTIAPILLGLTLPFALRIARTDHDRTLAGIVIAAVALKLLMAYVRFKVAFDVYGGRSDARLYHDVGIQLAPNFRKFDFSTDFDSLTSTNAIRFLTGVVYAIVGTGRITGFLVFAWIGFLGYLLLTRAFRIGVPSGDSRRYTIVVLLLPSLLYWPSAMGKEAPVMLGIGLAAYGIACFFQRRANGAIPFVAGLAIVLIIRPHMTLILFVGLVFAMIVRNAPARNYSAPLFRVLGAGALIAIGLFLSSQSSSFLDRNLKLDSGSITDQLDKTAERTSEAGSSFTPAQVRTPLDLPLATVTVLFRPFPFETSNSQGLLTSAEGMALIVALFACRKRLRSIPRLIRTTPYVAFSIGYLFAFIIAFSSFANFGILARQRVQMIPFLLVLIALPRHSDLLAADEQSADIRAVPEPETPAPVGARRRTRRPEPEPRERAPVSTGSSFPPPRRSAP